MLISSFLLEIYDLNKKFDKFEFISRMSLSLFLSFIMLTTLYFLIPFVEQGRGVLILSLVFFGLLQCLWQAFFRMWLRSPGFAKRVLILGTGPLAGQIGNLIATTKLNYVLAGYYNCASEPSYRSEGSVFGDKYNLLETAKKQNRSVSCPSAAVSWIVTERCLSGVDAFDAPSFMKR
jgi:hypothetical protein